MVSSKGASVPLLPEQRRFLARRLPEAHHWNQTGLYVIPEELTRDHLSTALTWVVNRHDGLRLSLKLDSEMGRGYVEAPGNAYQVDEVDLRGEDNPKVLTDICSAFQGVLNLEIAPLAWLVRIRWKRNDARLLIVVHHLLADGIGFDNFVQEIEFACQQLLAGKMLPEKAAPIGAHAYAEFLEGIANAQYVVDEVPTWMDLGRPSQPIPLEFAGDNTMATTDVVTIGLGVDFTRQIIVSSQRGRTRLGVLDAVIACLVPTLLPKDAEKRLRINMIGHGRFGLPSQPRVERTIGWLSTRYPMSFSVDVSAPFLSQRTSVTDQIAYVPNAGIGFGLLRYLNPDATIRTGLMELGEPEVTVNYRGRRRETSGEVLLRPAEESPGSEETLTGRREHVHGVDLLVEHDELQIIWYYSTNQFTRGTIESYVNELCERLRLGIGASN